jgi:hypothetical protein
MRLVDKFFSNTSVFFVGSFIRSRPVFLCNISRTMEGLFIFPRYCCAPEIHPVNLNGPETNQAIQAGPNQIKAGAMVDLSADEIMRRGDTCS